MSGIRKIAAFIAAQKKRIATVALGQAFNQIFDWMFNYPLYMFAVEQMGLTKGYIIMVVASFFICLAFIEFYDWLRVDWLGIEVAKEAKEYGPTFIRRMNIESGIGRILWWPFSKIILFILWAVNKGGLVAFMVLSIYTDPFITTVYMRKGWGEYNGLSRRDWAVFLTSTAIGNAYWAIRTFAILEVAKFSWKSLGG